MSEQNNASTTQDKISVINFKNLTFNILKFFDDPIVKIEKFPELDKCVLCNKEIFLSPIKSFTILACSHVFHRICIDKEILLTKENICPVKNCKKSIEILDQFSRQDSESSTASIVRRMEKYNIRSPQEIPEEDMSDVDNREGEDNLFKSPHKRSFVDTSKNKSPSKKAKKQVKREDSPILKKLIQELTSPTYQQVEGPITLQLSVSKIDVSSLDFLDLYNKIDTAENNLQRTTHDLIRCYYNFDQAIKQLFDHFRKTCNEDVSNARVNDRIRDQISVQDKLTETNLRKRKKRGKKVFRLFSNVGGKE